MQGVVPATNDRHPGPLLGELQGGGSANTGTATRYQHYFSTEAP